MSKADDVLLFDVIFVILLTSYGVAVPGVGLNGFQSIGTPPVSHPPAQGGCVPYVFLVWPICLNAIGGNSSIAVATENIAWAILNIPALIIWFISAVILWLNTILAITFSPGFSANGVPYLGLFFVGLQVYVISQVFRDFRGSGAGV